MGIYLLSAMSVILFCFSARQLITSITRVQRWAMVDAYSRKALKVERGYKIFAWSSLTLFLFVSMLASFLEAYFAL